MTQTSTIQDKRTNFIVSETFISETKEEMHTKLKERLLQVMTKKLVETGDKLDYNRPI